MGIKTSDKFKNMQKSLDKLPNVDWAKKQLKVFFKYQALLFIKNFHEGIKLDEFKLKRLKPATIAQKTKHGYKQPEVPLYAKGDSEKKNSYVNMMRLKELKDGYGVSPSTHKHWSGKIKLDKLLDVHENGRVIKVGKGKTAKLIKIPGRPAMSMAFKKTLASIEYKKSTAEVKERFVELIHNADKIKDTPKKRIMSFIKEMGKYEIRD